MGQTGTGGAGNGGGGTGRDIAPVEEMSRSGTLFPQGLTSTAEKKTFLTTQRERLRLLLTALDDQATGLEHEEMLERDVERRLGSAATHASASSLSPSSSSADGLRKSRSEAEFEAIERDDDDHDDNNWGAEKLGKNVKAAAAAGGWIPSSWVGGWGASAEAGKAKTTGAERGGGS